MPMYVGLRLMRLSKLKTPDFYRLGVVISARCASVLNKQVSIRRLYTSYQTLSHFITSLISGRSLNSSPSNCSGSAWE